jgi:energy-coupling factor transporter ATP-binding protein EcfA2
MEAATKSTEELTAPILNLRVISHTDEETSIECPIGELNFIPDSVHVVLSNHYEVQTVPVVLAVKSCVRRSPRRSTKQNLVSVSFTLKAKPFADRRLMEKKGSWRFSNAESYIVVDVDMEPLAVAVYRAKLNALFRGTTSKDPTTILLWGKSGSGKTALACTLINIIHRHSNGSDTINYSVLSNEKPNPIIKYPSSLVNLLDSSSTITNDIVGLMKTSQYADAKGTNFQAILFVLDISQNFTDLLSEIQLGHDWALQVNKKPILVLTHIERVPETLLAQAIIEIHRTFKYVVPIASYTSVARSTWTESAGSEILRLACN